MVGAVLSFAGPAAQAANFGVDINAAIDAGLQYARANNHFTTYTAANGLSLLALLEKETNPPGYNSLTAADKLLAQNSACILIDSGSFGDLPYFYSYYDGQALMGLSVYLETGGPDQPAASPGFDCTGRSARATIDKLVDRTIAAQNTFANYGRYAGYWGYTGNGYDSSTTQFSLAGLAAAKGFYAAKGESATPRIQAITDSLDLISGKLINNTMTGYAGNGKDETGVYTFTDCGAVGCYGHAYGATSGIYSNSSQQTASGTWGQLTGTGKNVNDPSIQRYLRWLQNAYSYNTNAYPESWPGFYFYYLWSSSKVYNIIHNSQIAPAAGNIGPDDIGTLPALTVSGIVRQTNLDPALQTRPASRGVGPAGFYAGEPKGWYFDYAYRLMSLQDATGVFNNPNGTWNAQVDHAYGLLVLERSLGGICIDSDNDGVCDSTDNCINTPNTNQANTDGDLFGNVCDNCPTTANNDQKDSNNNGIGDACEVAAKDCDVDKNGKINNADINLIKSALGTVPTGATDPRNPDHNGIINTRDVQICIGRLGQ
jgi:hypothetical protein